MDNIIQEGEVIFKKNPTVGLPEVSKLIDLVINKRQEGKMDSLWALRNITSLDGSCYDAIVSSILQNILSYLKVFSMQCRKNTTVEDKKKNEYSYLRNTWSNICDENDSNKMDSINSILQHGRVVDNNCFVVFSTLRFPYLLMWPR